MIPKIKALKDVTHENIIRDAGRTDGMFAILIGMGIIASSFDPILSILAGMAIIFLGSLQLIYSAQDKEIYCIEKGKNGKIQEIHIGNY